MSEVNGLSEPTGTMRVQSVQASMPAMGMSNEKYRAHAVLLKPQRCRVCYSKHLITSRCAGIPHIVHEGDLYGASNGVASKSLTSEPPILLTASLRLMEEDWPLDQAIRVVLSAAVLHHAVPIQDQCPRLNACPDRWGSRLRYWNVRMD